MKGSIFHSNWFRFTASEPQQNDFIKKRSWLKMMKRLLNEESGQGMVEYGLIIALVAIVLIGALTAMNGGLSSLFGKVTTAVQ
jgi:pilus assembly protein Flp/PilA